LENSATACPLEPPGLEVATVAGCHNHFTTWIVTAIIAARHAGDQSCGSTPRELSAMPHNILILMENPQRLDWSAAAARDVAAACGAGPGRIAPDGAAPRPCESPQSHHAWSLGLRNGPSPRQETKMPEAVPDTPHMQSARARKKTFTRHPYDTLRSHPSCISAGGVPLTDGAADVSGR
jgi:hypothetical protein